MSDAILLEILEELRAVRKIIERDAEPIPFIPQTPPYIPRALANKCVTCGITLDGVMGYACQRPDCPTGLGPVTC